MDYSAVLVEVRPDSATDLSAIAVNRALAVLCGHFASELGELLFRIRESLLIELQARFEQWNVRGRGCLSPADLAGIHLYGRWDDLGVSYRKQIASLCERGVLCELPGECYFSHWLSIPALFGPNGRSQLTRHSLRPVRGFVPGAAIEIRNAEQGAVRALIIRTDKAAIANHCCLRESMSCALRLRAFSRWC